MKNQAVVDIEDYYSLRKKSEENEIYIKELKKKESELLDKIKILKVGIIITATNNGIASMEPSFEIDHKDDTLIIRIKPTAKVTDRFKDVVVLR